MASTDHRSLRVLELKAPVIDVRPDDGAPLRAEPALSWRERQERRQRRLAEPSAPPRGWPPAAA